MISKKFKINLFILVLIFTCFVPMNFINAIEVESTAKSLDTIQEKVLASIPEKISTSVTTGIDKIEKWRIEKSTEINTKKDESNVQSDKEIGVIKSSFLDILSFILNNQIAFYLSLLVLLYVILRLIWKLIF